MFFFATVFAFFTIQDTSLDLQESAPTAATVIENFINAKGGESSLRKIKNYIIKGKVFSKQEITGEFEIYQAANRHLSIDRFPDGSTRQHGTDGKLAWQIDVDGKPTLLQGQQARDYIRHYETLHESLEWTNQFDAILYAGKKNFTGSQFASLDLRRARQPPNQSLFLRRNGIVDTRGTHRRIGEGHADCRQ